MRKATAMEREKRSRGRSMKVQEGVVTNLHPADALRQGRSVGHPWWMTEVRPMDGKGFITKRVIRDTCGT